MGHNVVGPWEKVKWFHPQRWRGARYKRWVWDDHSMGGPWDGSFEYATQNRYARLVLEERYGQAAWRASNDGKPWY